MTLFQHREHSQGIALFIDGLQKIQNHFASFDRKNMSVIDVLPLLAEGWDYTSNRRKVDEPNGGLWRAPHLAIVKNIDLVGADIYAIISHGMSVAQLKAGLWRQLRVFPKNEAWRRLAVDQEAHADPFAFEAGDDSGGDERSRLSNEIAAVDAGDRFRDDFFVTLIGHTVEDVSEFLFELEKSNPELARMLLAKDFMATIQADPACLDLPWPASCISRFKREKRADFLPPVLALILFTELARHAQVQATHNRLSFDKRGRRIDSKTVREDITAVAGGEALPATKMLLRSKWLQSSALLAPTAILTARDQAAACAWTEESRRMIWEFAHDAGTLGTDVVNSVLRPVLAPIPGAEVEIAVGDFISHPNVWSINRSDGTMSFPNRMAIMFYGMTWSESASVALTLIADQARSWSAQYRPENGIPKRRTDRRPSLGQAIAAIMYCWLETIVPKALYGNYRNTARQDGCEVVDANAMSAEDLVTSAESGKDLLREARQIIARVPGTGDKGFSALAHASLWIDRRHDDLCHYRAIAQESSVSIDEMNAANEGRARHGSIPPDVVASASFRGRGKRGLPGRVGKADSDRRRSHEAKRNAYEAAAIVAQAEAMLLGPTATDPMRAYLLRMARKPGGIVTERSAILPC